jgi:hypothetical protein
MFCTSAIHWPLYVTLLRTAVQNSLFDVELNLENFQQSDVIFDSQTPEGADWQ